MDRKLEEQIRRLRSLTGSIECLILCAMDLEDASAALASAAFLVGELRDTIGAVELAADGSIVAPAND